MTGWGVFYFVAVIRCFSALDFFYYSRITKQVHPQSLTPTLGYQKNQTPNGIMGDDYVPEAVMGFKGWRKYFNTYTKRGKTNFTSYGYCCSPMIKTSIVAFGIGIGFYVMKKLFGKKKTTGTA